MEKIKQALDKARQQRTATDGRGVGVPDISSISYTQTRSMETSHSAMVTSRLMHTTESRAFTDSVKILRTQILQRMSENEWNTLAVTSAGSGEGKTLTATNLGISIAMEVDYTVLLVDADLQNPSVHQLFGLQPEYGLGDYLQNDLPLADILIHPEGLGHFVLLPGISAVNNSSEMLASPKMSALVGELKNRYEKRIIIFDLPPVLETADALAFSPYIDAALLVVEDGKTSSRDLTTAIDVLSSTNIIGTVLNKSEY